MASLERVLVAQETIVADARISHLRECRTLSEPEVVALAAACKQRLLLEDNVVQVRAPVVVVGDTHGQFHDLLEVFRIAGNAPDTNYLFLGDYVDRHGRGLLHTAPRATCTRAAAVHGRSPAVLRHQLCK
jgi:serine/threonine-protein phosphatase 2A catalytic subunit